MGRPRKLFDGSIPAIGGQEVTFCAICVFGPKEGRPIEIACRSPNQETNTKLVRGDQDGVLHYVVWVVDRRQARIVRQECHRVLDKAGKRLDSRHFDITVEWAKKVVNFAGQERGIRLFSSEELAKTALSKEQLQFIDIVRGTEMAISRKDFLRVMGT